MSELMRRFSDWISERRLRRLLVMVPFFMIVYLIGTLVFHRVFGWQRQSWQEIIFWGLCMGVSFALWPPRRASTKLENR